MWDMAKKQKQAGEWRNRIVRTGTAPASEFKANERNWRVHPKAQRDALKGVLSEVGWVTGVITNVTTGNVIDGHARIEEALKLGDETPVPFVEVELSEAEEMKILATLDPLSAMAGADKEQLDALLREVETADAAVMQMLDDLAKANGLDYGKEGASDADAEPQIDKADELCVKWGVERGQVWQLGDHRLMCGDSTSAEDVARLMGGEKADMVFTDPPYNVASEGRNYAADAPTQKKTYEALKNSEWDKNFDIKPFLFETAKVLANDCAVYVCTSHWLVQTIWDWMFTWSKYCSYCVWCKPNPAPSLAKRHWTWATELIPYAVRGKHTCNFPKTGHALNWWAINSGTHTEPHPTQKPVEIPKKAIEFSSDSGAVVYDGFSGSGTTIIACEQLGRKCRAMEISPAYVAVALQRWADATGKTPALLDS